MPAGRRIPRPPDAPPHRPPPPDEFDTVVAADVGKAAGELSALAVCVRACTSCGPPDAIRVHGTGYPRAAVMLVKDLPSPEDLELGNAFASEAAALTKAFEALGVPLSWIYATSAVKSGEATCTPRDLGPCAAHLLTEIEAVQPRVVVGFGADTAAAIRCLHGRCGIVVPDDIGQGAPIALRGDLLLVVTEPLPEGLTSRDAKRRLWRDLQSVPKLIAV